MFFLSGLSLCLCLCFRVWLCVVLSCVVGSLSTCTLSLSNYSYIVDPAPSMLHIVLHLQRWDASMALLFEKFDTSLDMGCCILCTFNGACNWLIQPSVYVWVNTLVQSPTCSIIYFRIPVNSNECALCTNNQIFYSNYHFERKKWEHKMRANRAPISNTSMIL